MAFVIHNIILIQCHSCNLYYMNYAPFLCTGRRPHFQSICKAGQKLKTEGQLASKAIGHRVGQLQEKWKKLNDSANVRKTRLQEAAKSQQVRIYTYDLEEIKVLYMHTHAYARSSLSLYYINKPDNSSIGRREIILISILTPPPPQKMKKRELKGKLT